MLNFHHVRQQLIKLSLITLSLSLTLIALPVVKQALSSSNHQSQAAGPNPIITSISPDSGSVLGGETVTIQGENFDSFEWQEMSTGSFHTCALDEVGKAFCWGDNEYGQLGDGTKINHSVPKAIDSELAFVKISAGGSHSCALTDTNKAYCWGNNEDGQLGDTTEINQSSPVAVSSVLSFNQISAGGYHSCALTDTNKAYCWGNNEDGQLGDTTEINKSSPVAIAPAQSFSQISAGDKHSCARDTTNKAYCWGNDGSGQLGDGGTNISKSSPVAIAPALSFNQISAGGYHSCALTDTNKAYCWGFNYAGEVGTGDTNSQSSPIAIVPGQSFKQIAAGFFHSCAIDINDKAYCWGKDESGKLGDGGEDIDQLLPVAVGAELNFGLIDAGDYHTCGLDIVGRAFCWGDNEYDQLGDDGGNINQPSPVVVQIYQVSFGDTLARAFNVTDTSMQAIVPQRGAGAVDISLVRQVDDFVSTPAVNGYTYIGPLKPTITDIVVPGADLISGQTILINGANYFQKIEFSQISAGKYHTCALDTTGKAWCWGRDQDGQLGDGDLSYDDQLSLVAVDSDLAFSQISAGAYHSCALDTTGKAWCWGADWDGQLGNGDLIYDVQSSPVAVDSTRLFSQIVASEEHTCALERETGQAYCWGYDADGKLGNAANENSEVSSPVAVNYGLSFSQIVAGTNFTCALQNDTGRAYCWGSNGSGQLGYGGAMVWSAYESSPVAVDVSAYPKLYFSDISASYHHACGTDAISNVVYCWGSNSFGELGNNDIDGYNQALPVAAESESTFSQVAAGNYFTCAIDALGKAYCWGGDAEGQLGNGTVVTGNQVSPVAVESEVVFSHISGGGWHTCALDYAGKAHCWGSNSDGQLGINSKVDYSTPQLLPEFDPLLPQRLSVDFNNSILAPSFKMLNSGQIEAVIPAGVNYPAKFTVTNPDTQSVTFIPAGIMEPVVSELGSPALDGPFNIESAGYLINLVIDGSTYPAINNGDGTWSLPAGTITPDLNPGVYDVIVQVLTPTSDPVSETMIADGLTILGNGTPTDPTGPIDPTTNPTDPNSPSSPATGYGPQAMASSISGFLIPSLVITMIGVGMLVMTKKYSNRHN